MAKKNSLCPIFIPHYGCPNACVFCNQHKITGTSKILKPNEIKAYFLSWQAHTKKASGLAYYGGSFTALDERVQEAYLKAAQELKEMGLISELRLSTRPDCLDEAVLLRLKAFEVDTIEIGVQSLFDEVLQANQRGHTKQSSLEAIARTKAYGFKVGGQMMLGLYKDSPFFAIQTAKWLSESGIEMVRIYPTLVLQETELARLYLAGLYRPWGREKVLDTLSFCIAPFLEKKIPIIRIGLQEEAHLYQGILAGYHHPALGEEAYSRYIRNQIEAIPLSNQKALTIGVSPQWLSKAIGQKRENLKYFKEKKALSLSIIPDESVAEGEVRLCSSND